jgi:hypothetical protein
MDEEDLIAIAEEVFLELDGTEETGADGIEGPPPS